MSGKGDPVPGAWDSRCYRDCSVCGVEDTGTGEEIGSLYREDKKRNCGIFLSSLAVRELYHAVIPSGEGTAFSVL